MNWTLIISNLAALIGGGALSTLVTLRATRKKAGADADKRCECTTKGYYMCIHQGCVLRRPSLGRGKEYYKAHAADADFGADYTPVEDLLAEHRKTQENGDDQ